MREDIILVAFIVLGVLGTIVIIWLARISKFLGNEYKKGQLNHVVNDSDMLALIYFPKKRTVEFVSDSAGWLFGIEKDLVYHDVEYLFKKMNLPMTDDIIQDFCQGTLILSRQKEFSVLCGPDESLRHINLRTRPCGRGRYLLTIREETLKHEMSETLRVLLDAFEQEYKEKKILLSLLQDKNRPEEEVEMACRGVLEIFGELAEEDRPLKIAAFSVRRMLREVVDALSDEIEQKGQKLELNLSMMHETVLGDKEHVRRTVRELLENAVRYTPEGGTVTLSVKQSAVNRDGTVDLVIVVEDSGIGIREDFMPKLFEPFERADDPMVRSVDGKGLGLRIVRGLAERMGGRVEVQSEVNRGSRFSVYLQFGLPHGSFIKGE